MDETYKIDWKETHKKEAVAYVKSFYKTSYDWRANGSTGYHNKWDRWERNYNNIYDPAIVAKKEPWQSTMFIPYSVTNVEVITSALFKILMGKRQSLSFRPREFGDELQAELQTDVLSFELDKCDFQMEFYKTLKECGIFGSGFMKFYWEKKEENRRVMKPVRLGFAGTARSILRGEMRSPSEVVGFEQKTETVLAVDRCHAENVHIRDIFLEPNSKDLSRILHRQKITYNELLALSKQKNADGKPLVDPKSVEELLMMVEPDTFELDLAPSKYAVGETDPLLARPDYNKNHTVFEFWGPIPRKWIDLEMSEEGEENKKKANEMVEGKIMVATGDYYLASEENPYPSMQTPFVKFDYIPTGYTYGKGICQLIEGLQEEGNEIRNLRVDNVNLTMNKILVVVEKFLRDPNEVRSMPGAVIRLKGTEVTNANQGVFPLEIPPIDIGGYKETVEIERQIENTTAANRVATSGAPAGSNDTLGGMELARQAAYDRFSVYAFLMGLTLKKAILKIMELSYQNSSPERIRRVLGEVPVEFMPDQWMPRWQLYKVIPPHEMTDMYDVVPADIFGMENKSQKAQSLASMGQLFASLIPGWDPKPLLKKLGHYNEFTQAEVDELIKALPQGPIPTPLGMGQGVPSISKASQSQTGEVAPPSSTSAMGMPS
ncbi:MAG TPA: hypothetical protein PLP33_23835 [Leptospiraceae bacterium]|jgi:hypothetical protein|nr:hypothetical protein [Leptospiraceae bacterium]